MCKHSTGCGLGGGVGGEYVYSLLGVLEENQVVCCR